MKTDNKNKPIDIVEAGVKLVNDKMRFLGTAGNNEPVYTDYIPPLGDSQGYMSLQLFLVSLASCIGGSVIVLLRKMKKNIRSCEIKTQGFRRTEHPTSFEKILIEFRIKSENILPSDIEKVIAMSEETYCPVLAMIKGNVIVETKYSLES